MRALVTLVGLGLLTACSAGEVAQPTEGERATLDPTYAGPQSLVGEWRVAGVDNASIDLAWAVTVSVTPTRISYASQCVSGTWDYELKGGRVATEYVPLAVCDRGRYPAEEALDAVFDAGPTVETTPENGILLTGGGHSITLFSQ